MNVYALGFLVSEKTELKYVKSLYFDNNVKDLFVLTRTMSFYIIYKVTNVSYCTL